MNFVWYWHFDPSFDQQSSLYSVWVNFTANEDIWKNFSFLVIATSQTCVWAYLFECVWVFRSLRTHFLEFSLNWVTSSFQQPCLVLLHMSPAKPSTEPINFVWRWKISRWGVNLFKEKSKGREKHEKRKQSEEKKENNNFVVQLSRKQTITKQIELQNVYNWDRNCN